VAVLAVVMGTATALPPRHHGEAADMAPTGVDLLVGIGTGEPLPQVTPPDPDTADAPRQVAGPDPLPDPVTPPAPTPTNPAPTSTPAAPYVVGAGASRTIPPQVLAAYQAAARTMATEQSSCHLPWALLAGIGRIESGHAEGGNLDATGRARTPIIGPKLDGTGNFARIMDSDGGLWDGDPKYDRAVGPMQFLPDTWRGVGRDANGDGTPDPENINDAALGAAVYLCAGGGDLATRNGLLAAVYRYNRSWEYVSMVLTWAGIYAGALPTVAITPTPTPSTAPTGKPSKHPSTGPTPQPTTPTAPIATPNPTPSLPATPPATSTPAPQPSTPAQAPAPVTTGTLIGQVVDQLGNPVAGVTVLLHGPSEVSVLTDATGAWQAAELVAGDYTVQIAELDGFQVPAEPTAPIAVPVGQTLTLTPFALVALLPATPAAGSDPGTSVVTSGG